jgi:hypothetical protein
MVNDQTPAGTIGNGAMTPDQVAAIVRDPRWLAHRYDPGFDAVHFRYVDRAARGRAAFLTDEYLGSLEPLPLARGSLGATTRAVEAPLHYIFHSAFCCSTLMARAFERPGWTSALSEPVILNDLAGWRMRGAPAHALTAVARDAAALLGRRFDGEVAVIAKGSNTAGLVADLMLGAQPGSRALLMVAPIRTFLTSVAKKGLDGRLWVRGVFGTLQQGGITDFGFDPPALFGQTDLQIAALGWLAQHRLFHRLVQAFGPDCVRTLDSERFLADPLAAVAQAARLFGLPDIGKHVAAIADSRLFTSHSKTGAAFGQDDRRRDYAQASAAYGEEIDKVATWTERVAEHARVPIALPAPLLD